MFVLCEFLGHVETLCNDKRTTGYESQAVRSLRGPWQAHPQRVDALEWTVRRKHRARRNGMDASPLMKPTVRGVR